MTNSSVKTAQPDYSRAVNEALATLAIADFGTPRVSLAKLIGYMGSSVTAMSYGTAVSLGCPAFALYGGAKYAVSMSSGQDGRSMILYNDRMPLPTVRFSVAHELGHILLRHRQNADNYDALEREADCFARNLLCPVSTEDYLGGFDGDPDAFVRVFGVSEYMAKICAVYRSSDYHYADKTLLTELTELTADRIDAYFGALKNDVKNAARPPASGIDRWLIDRSAEYAEDRFRYDEL